MGSLVSVVIPTYQRAALLEEAVRSVLAQTYGELEVLVEDDGSTDGTEAAVARLGDPRVSYARAANVGRPAPVRNRAIARARGVFVAFLDSDDVWEARKLEAQLAVLEGDPTLLAVASDASWLPPRKHTLLVPVPAPRPSFEELLARNVVITSTVIIRREALGAIGGFDESVELRFGEDYDLWLRLLRYRERSIAVLPEALVRYREGDGLSIHGRRELEAIRRIAAKHQDYRPEAIAQVLAARERNLRQGELRDGLRSGSLALADWLRAPEVPLRRRLRYAARAVLFGRKST